MISIRDRDYHFPISKSRYQYRTLQQRCITVNNALQYNYNILHCLYIYRHIVSIYRYLWQILGYQL